jgi:DNA-binding NtrC family response regulator
VERALEAYAWPGNVRELEHQMQRLAALRVGRVELEHLSREIRAVRRAPARSKTRAALARKTGAAPGSTEGERRQVQSALAAARGNITHAANALSLTRQGLKKKMVRLGLREPVSFARGRSK